MIRLKSLGFVPILLIALAGCQDALESVADKVEHPLPQKLVNKMKANDMSVRSPIMMRIFKEEGILEVWKQKGNGRYDRIAEYEICKWSGKLGPKIKEGDRQAPEGYYRVYPAQMNPRSSYYLSFNMGFPNSFDRALGRTGTNLMVHGACSSAGCYSMTDEQVLEIYGFARDAFRGGQEFFLVEALPFRMTPENMARHRKDENYEFWKMLKVGYDHFELTKQPPKVDVCDRRYVFNQQTESPDAKFSASSVCPQMFTPPTLAYAYQAYEKNWNTAFEKAVAEVERTEAKNLTAQTAKAEAEATRIAREQATADSPTPIANLFSLSGRTPSASAPGGGANALVPESATAAEVSASSNAPGTVPVPSRNPLAAQTVNGPQQSQPSRPFWKIWSSK